MVDKITIGLLSLTLSSGCLFAQAAGNQSQEQATPQASSQASEAGSLSFLAELDSQAEAVSNARNSADEYLAKKGWSEGLNKDGRYVAIGVAQIDASPSDKNFQLYRINAYKKAMLNAKASISKFFAQEISTRAKLVITEPPSAATLQAQAEAEAQIPPSILQKVTTLVHKKLDKELEKEGVTYESEKAKPIIEDLLNKSSFSDSILALSKTQVGALITSKIFEQDGEMVVVAYYSDKTKLLAGAINGTGATPKVKPRKGDPAGVWVKKLKVSQLYPSIGVQMTSDEDGNIVILSYGQSKARSKSSTSKDMAYEKASLEADGFIRNFAGETVAYAGEKKMQEETKEFSDETTSSFIEETMSKRIETEAKALPISGISTIHRWSLTDPRSNSIICGVVRMWSLKTSDSANSSREEMKDATINRGGHMKVKSTASGSSSTTTRIQNTSSIKSTGDQNKYKTQSVESEDF